MKKKFFAFLIFFLPSFFIFAQPDSFKVEKTSFNRRTYPPPRVYTHGDSVKLAKHRCNRYVIRMLPSYAENIYGIAIGPFGSDVICNSYYPKSSHGLNIQLFGQGFIQLFYIGKPAMARIFMEITREDSQVVADSSWRKAIHNGIMVSTLGTFTHRVNGISASCMVSAGERVNGISFNLLWNLYQQVNGIAIGMVNQTYLTRGLQVGVWNKSTKLRGFQFGLWNQTAKRSLPFINWGFR